MLWLALLPPVLLLILNIIPALATLVILDRRQDMRIRTAGFILGFVGSVNILYFAFIIYKIPLFYIDFSHIYK